MNEIEIRKFLNRKGTNGIAAICISHDGRYGAATITDCSRTISLDLSAGTKKDKRNTLFKLDTMIAALSEARTSIAA